MKPRADTSKERQRVLRFLADRPAQRPWPICNKAMQAMLSEGLIEVTHRWRQVMATRCYDCVKIDLTEAGRAAIVSANTNHD